MKKNIGKNTLGDSNKMSVYLHGYGRSTHNLSYAWRSTMGVGTLVPFMKILALPGDTWDIALDEKVITHPTVGPLFGNYKLQMDVFTCPIRLYNAMLHNNALHIGLDMAKVKIPQLITNQTTTKYSSSSLMNYLGIKGTKKQRNSFNAVPYLAYLDIFKNYYANKQEEYFYEIKSGEGTVNDININNPRIYIDTSNGTWEAAQNIEIEFGAALQGDISKIIINFNQGTGVTFQTTIEELKWNYTIGGQNNNKVIMWVEDGTKIPNGMQPTSSATITSAQYTGELELQLVQRELTDLDELREDILSKGRQLYTIGNNGNCEIEWINDNIRNGGTGTMDGLLIKTLQSDIFNNWVNSEWIDGENGITNLTKIDTSAGSFSIDTLNLAEKVYNMLNRIAVSGGSYKDWIESVYTTDYYFRAETPVYEGGMSATIDFAEVVSNSATTDEPLGTIAGRGFATNKKGGKLKIKINEPSYIIGIVSITPNVDYGQGYDWDMIELKTLDDLHKPQLDGIGFQDLLCETMDWRATVNSAVGKSVAWINYMTNFNKTFGNFAKGENESFMVLNRQYETNEKGDILNATTYINPKDYTYIFAENDIKNMDFWVQIGCGIEARRVMSAKQIPLM